QKLRRDALTNRTLRGASMANDEHVAILKKGTEAWNAWRKENPDIRPDLREANLRDADLSQANLGVDFKQPWPWRNLSGVDLSGANLTWANLVWATLSKANLSGAYLSSAFLMGADLTGANLTRANFHDGANLSRANLTGAYGNVSFKGSSLMRANLRQAN